MKFDFLSESDKAYYIHKASTLVEAIPYIREHAGQKFVIKYGGHAMGDTELSHSFSKDIVFVHFMESILIFTKMIIIVKIKTHW